MGTSDQRTAQRVEIPQGRCRCNWCCLSFVADNIGPFCPFLKCDQKSTAVSRRENTTTRDLRFRVSFVIHRHALMAHFSNPQNLAPKFNVEPESGGFQHRNHLFQGCIFKLHGSLRKCMTPKTSDLNNSQIPSGTSKTKQKNILQSRKTCRKNCCLRKNIVHAKSYVSFQPTSEPSVEFSDYPAGKDETKPSTLWC